MGQEGRSECYSRRKRRQTISHNIGDTDVRRESDWMDIKRTDESVHDLLFTCHVHFYATASAGNGKLEDQRTLISRGRGNEGNR